MAKEKESNFCICGCPLDPGVHFCSRFCKRSHDNDELLKKLKAKTEKAESKKKTSKKKVQKGQ